MGLMKLLYNISRTTGKAARTMNDVSTLTSGDPKRIAKRAKSKVVNKATNEIRKNINKLIK